MNVFNKVTLQSLKKNKTRTIVTIIGIILSAAMICAVTTFASSIMNYAQENTIYSDGNWHGYQKDTDYKTYEDIVAAGKVEEAIYLQQLGNAYAEGCENEFKPYIYVLGAGKNVEDVLPIHITSGKYPTSSTEIMLPEHLYINGGVKYNLGDKITLELGQRMLDGYPMTQSSPCYIYEQGQEVFNGETLEIKETRTYTVVGFYERLSWRIEDFESPGYTALTIADKDTNGEYNYDVYFRMKNPKDTFDFMQKMKLEGDVNNDLLMYSGTFAVNGFTTMLYSLAAIVIGLIMFGSVSLIYNAFSISVSERTKQFGLLSSIGATKKQLRKMVLFEAYLIWMFCGEISLHYVLAFSGLIIMTLLGTNTNTLQIHFAHQLPNILYCDPFTLIFQDCMNLRSSIYLVTVIIGVPDFGFHHLASFCGLCIALQFSVYVVIECSPRNPQRFTHKPHAILFLMVKFLKYLKPLV